MGRSANITRTTKETDIAVSLELDGTGQGTIETGIGFFDHMLEGFKKHGFFIKKLTEKCWQNKKYLIKMHSVNE